MKTLLTSALLLSVLLMPTAEAGFTGSYAVSNWTATLAGNDVIDTSGAPFSISLTSDDSGTGGDTLFEVSAAGTGNLSFNWSYSSSDPSGPTYDPFGYTLNGLFFQLSNDSGGNLQSSAFSLAVAAGDLFAFAASSDGLGGAATTTISNFNGPASAPVNVDAPDVIWLLMMGFSGLAFVNGRAKSAQGNLIIRHLEVLL